MGEPFISDRTVEDSVWTLYSPCGDAMESPEDRTADAENLKEFANILDALMFARMKTEYAGKIVESVDKQLTELAQRIRKTIERGTDGEKEEKETCP